MRERNFYRNLKIDGTNIVADMVEGDKVIYGKMIVATQPTVVGSLRATTFHFPDLIDGRCYADMEALYKDVCGVIDFCFKEDSIGWYCAEPIMTKYLSSCFTMPDGTCYKQHKYLREDMVLVTTPYYRSRYQRVIEVDEKLTKNGKVIELHTGFKFTDFCGTSRFDYIEDHYRARDYFAKGAWIYAARYNERTKDYTLIKYIPAMVSITDEQWQMCPGCQPTIIRATYGLIKLKVWSFVSEFNIKQLYEMWADDPETAHTVFQGIVEEFKKVEMDWDIYNECFNRS